MDIANKVKSLRIKNGWSRQDLANESGLSCRTVERIENGRTSPNLRSKTRLAKAFGIAVEQLLAPLILSAVESRRFALEVWMNGQILLQRASDSPFQDLAVGDELYLERDRSIPAKERRWLRVVNRRHIKWAEGNETLIAECEYIDLPRRSPDEIVVRRVNTLFFELVRAPQSSIRLTVSDYYELTLNKRRIFNLETPFESILARLQYMAQVPEGKEVGAIEMRLDEQSTARFNIKIETTGIPTVTITQA